MCEFYHLELEDIKENLAQVARFSVTAANLCLVVFVNFSDFVWISAINFG